MIKNSAYAVVLSVIFLCHCTTKNDGNIMTVNGPVPASEMGITLEHEHILVDFIGADSISPSRWIDQEVAAAALPFLREAQKAGCSTFIECTPAFLGRDPELLNSLSAASGLNIITNTGLYGAGNNKYLPRYAFDETANQLAARWIMEWENGIDGTKVKPGFIKIGVGPDSLSDVHRKLVTAAALTHLKTGLTIASHTGRSIPAFEQIEILKKEGVSPAAFIWVHAQNEKDIVKHVEAARMGAWVSFDGINDENMEEYLQLLKNMKQNHLLDKVLISHDSGWYRPGEQNGGEYNGYTTIFEKFIPMLKNEKFSEKEIQQILILNPKEAFTIRFRTQS
jgi:phosphotriesterase-related protein